MVHNRNVLAISLALFLSAHSERATSLELPASNSGPDYLNVGGPSYHFNYRGDRVIGANETNAGLGITWAEREFADYGKFDASLGVYYNSSSRASFYATLSKLPISFVGGKFGITAGLVTGYELAPVLPFIAPTGCWKYACLLVVPPIRGTSFGIVSLQFRTPF